ncbi:C39 family peptidase [Verrucomicrobiales bacterium BCK34]|nr:C39 family peptidase [Verrucomicrobiales bacterium BCK34]
MKIPQCLCVILLIVGLSGNASAEAYRVFTNSQGKTITAKVLSVDGASATIEMETGKKFTLPLTALSPADQEFLRTWSPGAPSPPAAIETTGITGVEAINESIGQELFKDTTLWNSSPEEVAQRLGWRRESKTIDSESYRAYPGDDYRFLGARPYSAAMYGEDGKVTSISIVFANKGDSFGARGSGEEHFIKGKPVPGGMEGLRVIMENDAELISTALTAKLGEPDRQKFGEGESRVNVNRWDWGGHSFLLSNVEDEYVSLAIEKPEFADDRGKSKRVSDATIRERARGFVERRENGDVVISNIPMVDQGPKGYCVPATAERCMRFLGIPADMYLLAMAGETSAGGGTSVDRLLNNIGSDIKRKGRSFDIESGELKMRDVQKSIDDGIPIIWAVYSTTEFNATSSERTAERQEGDWERYKAKVLKSAGDPALTPDRNKGHVVIIMGYNESTNEIAFSDSWGERYLERWITIPEAEQVSQKRFYIIGL